MLSHPESESVSPSPAHTSALFCLLLPEPPGCVYVQVLVSLWQNPPRQLRPNFTGWRNVSHRPLHGDCFWNLSPSPSCLTLFKYFKWVCGGEITWLSEEHLYINQTDEEISVKCFDSFLGSRSLTKNSKDCQTDMIGQHYLHAHTRFLP